MCIVAVSAVKERPFDSFFLLTFLVLYVVRTPYRTIHHNLQAFAPTSKAFARPCTQVHVNIAEGVDFDTVAREWRCKWSPDGDKASLVAAQKALEAVLPEIKKVDGVKGVERVVCGGCLDFKVITSLPQPKFGAWEEEGFTPESDFLEMLKDIDGISQVETQTYTVRSILLLHNMIAMSLSICDEKGFLFLMFVCSFHRKCPSCEPVRATLLES
jgi:hypothetical protein